MTVEIVNLANQLELKRCPHCRIANPQLPGVHQLESSAHDKSNKRVWRIYECVTCGGLVMAWASKLGAQVQQIFPESGTVAKAIPERARAYLTQAVESLHAPSGAVMLAASAVDAMLKHKLYKDGSLYTRINKAADDHLITKEMAEWAHDVRLDANDERHVEEKASLPDQANAKKCVEFAKALGEFLFVLPDRVERGLKDAKSDDNA